LPQVKTQHTASPIASATVPAVAKPSATQTRFGVSAGIGPAGRKQ
jgi:hypothetical protein